MKILKYILLLILALVVIGVIMAFMQPDKYDVSRSRVIKAPAKVIYDNVIDFKTWDKWGPWMELDPEMEMTYNDVSAGVGGGYSWKSESQGNGSMKTLFATENASIDQEIIFEDMDPSTVYWKFDEVEEGTNVTWGMKGDAPFMFRLIAAVSGGFEKMLAPMYEDGLEKLDTYIMEQMTKNPPKNYRVGAVSTKDMEEKKFIGFKHNTEIDHEKLSALFNQEMPKAGMYAAEKGLKEGDYIPGSVYTKWDEKTNEVEMYIGLLLNSELEAGEGMETVTLPESKWVMVSKFGNYGDGDMEAHEALGNYLNANNLMQNGPVLELYVNDPTTVKPEDIQTDIYYPVKEKTAE